MAQINVRMASIKKAQMKVYEEHYSSKYPDMIIVPGSFDQQEDHPVLKSKVFCKLVCHHCLEAVQTEIAEQNPDADTETCRQLAIEKMIAEGDVHDRATSDFHTWDGCRNCRKVVKKTTGLQDKLIKKLAKQLGKTVAEVKVMLAEEDGDEQE